ncbi:MAG: sulfate transporter [Candidatus Cloacimonas sp. SDB]|nr:MAG: sulfate transporter [Candidatus Cloacimonas sp. SDB]
MTKRDTIIKDANGREYPAKILDPQIVKRHNLVNRVIGRAARLHDKIAFEKQRMAEEIDKYLAQTAEQYGEQWKGNAELVSFDGKYKIEVRNRERIEFDEKLQIAKQKIDDCLKRWTQDSNVNLQAVINEAFQVDKKGEIAKHRILALRKYNIKDKNWKQAMQLIDEAIQVTSTKQYIAFYKRSGKNKPFQLISLNFSAI